MRPLLKLTFTFLFLLSLNILNAQKIHFAQSNYSFNEILELPADKWKNLETPIYNGLNNGIYWFKIELEPSSHDKVLHIPESHISRANLFTKDGQEIQKEKDRYVTFKLEASNKEKELYLKVNCLLEASIPLKIEKESSFYKTNNTQIITIGIYLGIVLSIILFHLLSFISFRNKTYLLYIFMVLGMSIDVLYKDGISALIFGINGINEWIELPINSIVVIASVFFVPSYLNIGEKYKKIRLLGVALIVTAFLLWFTQLYTGEFIYFALTDIALLLALDVFWVLGVLEWKKSFDAKLFTLAYGIPLIAGHDLYISPHFGLSGLQLPAITFQLGSITEMVVFTIGIMYQAKQLNKENTRFKSLIKDYIKRLEQAEKNNGISLEDKLGQDFDLTPQEIRVVLLILEDKTNKEISDDLFVSINTIKFHIKNILKKFEISSKTEIKEKLRS